jgi:hypothetical protein
VQFSFSCLALKIYCRNIKQSILFVWVDDIIIIELVSFLVVISKYFDLISRSTHFILFLVA